MSSIVMTASASAAKGDTYIPYHNLGQNEAEYRKLNAYLAEPRQVDRVEALRREVSAMFPHFELHVSANRCTRGWAPGTPGDVSLYLGLRRADGSNILSYCGGGINLETALKRARYTLEDMAHRYAYKIIGAAMGNSPYYYPMGRAYRDDEWTDVEEPA